MNFWYLWKSTQSKNIDLNCFSFTSNMETTFMFACEYGHEDAVKLLLGFSELISMITVVNKKLLLCLHVKENNSKWSDYYWITQKIKCLKITDPPFCLFRGKYLLRSNCLPATLTARPNWSLLQEKHKTVYLNSWQERMQTTEID